MCFFDLFFTLVYPKYKNQNNEFNILGISSKEWEKYAENNILYEERALGKVKSEIEIIDKIIEISPYTVSVEQKQQILYCREMRMKSALLNISDEIINTLQELRKTGIKTCLISNADMIDCKYWGNSRLANCFDNTIFSCDVGLLKPDVRIYELAMRQLGVNCEESVFIGDGGSNELAGAKEANMTTIFTEYLEAKSSKKRKDIMLYTDYYITDFTQIIKYVKL